MLLKILLVTIIMMTSWAAPETYSQSKAEQSGQKARQAWEKTKNKTTQVSKDTYDKVKKTSSEFKKGWKKEDQKIKGKKRRQ